MNYISFIPLIGGMAIANYQATGKKPKYVLSYDAFAKNESNLKNYWPDVEWKLLDAETNTMEEQLDYSNIDFVSSVCPCAGMSAMSSTHSPDSETNNWLYKAAEYILGTIKPKVYFGENAPGLYSDNNIKVANKLREYAEQYGYAFTIYKTDTQLHGIPQRRVRTFFFFWKGDYCPEMDYYNVSSKPFEEWILDKNIGVAHTEVSNRVIEKDFLEVKYIMETKCNDNYSNYVQFYKDIMNKDGYRINTPCEYFDRYNCWGDYVDWLKDKPEAHLPINKNGKKSAYDIASYRYDKVQNGGRYFANQPTCYREYTGALTGRNVELIIHPKEQRYLTLREGMALMGLPQDFEVITKNPVHITQNVPVCTAKDMTEQAIKFCKGKLKMTNYKYIKQNNLTQKIDYKE